MGTLRFIGRSSFFPGAQSCVVLPQDTTRHLQEQVLWLDGVELVEPLQGRPEDLRLRLDVSGSGLHEVSG
jgi:hypothetical protein